MNIEERHREKIASMRQDFLIDRDAVVALSMGVNLLTIAKWAGRLKGDRDAGRATAAQAWHFFHGVTPQQKARRLRRAARRIDFNARPPFSLAPDDEARA